MLNLQIKESQSGDIHILAPGSLVTFTVTHRNNILLKKSFTKEDQDESGIIKFPVLPDDTACLKAVSCLYQVKLHTADDEVVTVIPPESLTIMPGADEPGRSKGGNT